MSHGSSPGMSGAMTIDIDVVPFAASHTRSVQDLIVAIQQRELGLPITLADLTDLHDIARTYRTGSGNFWVALRKPENAIVGTIGLFDLGEGVAELRKMYVDASVRGREHAVAPRLLDVLLAWSRAHGIRTIFLGTGSDFHAAHRFYEKHGFVEVPRGLLPSGFPQVAAETKFYSLSL